MIDLLLKEQKNRTKINDVRVKSQHEIDSDHYFIGAKLKGGTYIHIKKKTEKMEARIKQVQATQKVCEMLKKSNRRN
mgnify:CR=1 FL=1